MPRRASALAVPGPIAATPRRAECACVEAGRCEAAVEERVDPVRGREDDPRVARQLRELEVDRVERDRGELQHLGAEFLEA